MRNYVNSIYITYDFAPHSKYTDFLSFSESLGKNIAITKDAMMVALKTTIELVTNFCGICCKLYRKLNLTKKIILFNSNGLGPLKIIEIKLLLVLLGNLFYKK